MGRNHSFFALHFQTPKPASREGRFSLDNIDEKKKEVSNRLDYRENAPNTILQYKLSSIWASNEYFYFTFTR